MKLPRKQKKALKKACQPLIMVFYIDVGNISMSDVSGYVRKVREQLNLDSDDRNKFYIVPIKGETRVECVNYPHTAEPM